MNAKQAWNHRQPTQFVQIFESFVDAGYDIAVSDRDEDVNLPGRFFLRGNDLLPNFEGGGLFAFGCKGIVACVAAVPAKFLRGLDRQVESRIVIPIHQDDLRAKDEQLRDLGRRRRLGGKNDRFLPNRGGHSRQRRSGVAG